MSFPPASLEVIVGAPTAVVAAGTILSYAVGIIRPVSVRARYWLTAEGAELSLNVKNRLWHRPRTLTKVGLVTLPPLRKRLPGWRRRDGVQASPYAPVGKRIGKIRDEGAKIDPRDEIAVRCRVLGPDGKPLARDAVLPDRLRVQVNFAEARPAVARPRLRSPG